MRGGKRVSLSSVQRQPCGVEGSATTEGRTFGGTQAKDCTQAAKCIRSSVELDSTGCGLPLAHDWRWNFPQRCSVLLQVLYQAGSKEANAIHIVVSTGHEYWVLGTQVVTGRRQVARTVLRGIETVQQHRFTLQRWGCDFWERKKGEPPFSVSTSL